MSSSVWCEKARGLKREVYALYFAVRDPRVPWYAKALAACVVGYALSPIDLIPDFIPVLGYLDELLLIPLGVLAVRAMIPAGVLVECRVDRGAARRAAPEYRPGHAGGVPRGASAMTTRRRLKAPPGSRAAARGAGRGS